MDNLIDEKEMSVDKDAFRHVKRDWVTLLAPAILAAILSAGSSVAVCGYLVGGMNQRLSDLESFKNKVEGDYTPKEQFIRFMDQQEKQAERIAHTLERIEDRQEKLMDPKVH